MRCARLKACGDGDVSAGTRRWEKGWEVGDETGPGGGRDVVVRDTVRDTSEPGHGSGRCGEGHQQGHRGEGHGEGHIRAGTRTWETW